jgi:hypothetical protein
MATMNNSPDMNMKNSGILKELLKYNVSDKEMLKGIKNISNKLNFEKLLFLKRMDINNSKKMIESGDLIYQGKSLNEDQKTDLLKLLNDEKVVKNLLFDNGVKLNEMFSKSKSLSRTITRNNKLTSEMLPSPPATIGGARGAEYYPYVEESSLNIANNAVRDFMSNHNYTDFLITNEFIISDINLAAYMLYGNVLHASEDHLRASRAVLLFRISLCFRIVLANCSVIGFLYLIYRNSLQGRLSPQELLRHINSLVFNAFTFAPGNVTDVQVENQRTVVGMLFNTVYRMINAVIPIRLTMGVVLGSFFLFGETIRDVLEPPAVHQNGIQVAQPQASNNIIISFILTGASLGVAGRRALLSSPQIINDLINVFINRNADNIVQDQPPMGFSTIAPGTMRDTSTGQQYYHGELRTPRYEATSREALRAVGFEPRRAAPEPPEPRFPQRRTAASPRRLTAPTYGPEENLGIFYRHDLTPDQENVGDFYRYHDGRGSKQSKKRGKKESKKRGKKESKNKRGKSKGKKGKGKKGKGKKGGTRKIRH